MTSGPINLNRYRKQQARAEKRARADANAARFGRSKAERTADQIQSEKARQTLDNHALDRESDTKATDDTDQGDGS